MKFRNILRDGLIAALVVVPLVIGIYAYAEDQRILNEKGQPVSMSVPFPVAVGNSSSVDAFGRLRIRGPGIDP